MTELLTAAVLSRPGCRYCDLAYDVLSEVGIPHMTFDVRGEDHTLRHFVKEAGFKTVPQIFINGKHIGGYDDLVEWVNHMY